MIDLKDVAIQSYCLRGFRTNEEVIEKVKECGFNKIELCRAHIDFFDASQHDSVIKLYREAGIKIVSIGVEGFTNNLEKEELLFKFAQKAGSSTISADFYPDTAPEAFRTAEKLVNKYGINLAVHNHGSRHWLGPVQMLDYIFNKTGKQIGLMLDTAWALDSREKPVEMMSRFADRIYGIHLKDFIFNEAAQPEDIIVGEGNLDLNVFMSKLKEIDYNGNLILEYEGNIDNPIPALKECIDNIYNMFKS